MLKRKMCVKTLNIFRTTNQLSKKKINDINALFRSRIHKFNQQLDVTEAHMEEKN